MKQPNFSFIVREALRGRTIGRIYFNHMIRNESSVISGRVLDLAGGNNPSYLEFLPNAIDLVRTDLKPYPGVCVVDANKPLPFEGNSFNIVLLCNAVYALENPQVLLHEVYRVLAPGGRLLLVSPFIANEMPEPHDYQRFTAEGLECLLRASNLRLVSLERMGDRASASIQLLHPFLCFGILRIFAYIVAMALDRYIPARVSRAHPAPIGYFIWAVK